MIDISINGTYEGKPLAVLGDLIAARQRLLGESTQDAVVATGIDALNSLRRLTRTAYGKKRADVDIRRVADVEFSFTRSGGSVRPCLRRGGVRIDAPFYNLTNRGNEKSAKVFFVTPKHANVRPHYVVALSAADVKQYEARLLQKRVARHGGLARLAYSTAMVKLSTRNVAERGSALARLKASRLATARTFTAGNVFTLEFNDSLNYARSALKGGAAAIPLALKRAANKIAGRLAQVAKRKFNATIPTPFPEVKQRRAN